ncbi:DUF6221 family protein [Streptomyces canus]|uniref:DUF6221 family protein n=1 Tax=Streptomyces canus TaxID=58343 RepID=UPI00224F800D|nr:DUF6221 family protein [Streptomyces canus]MCX5253645.1 DUF6221 family protein [Streptomyces canus]
MSIVEFLRARYAERRAIAEAAAGLQCDPENGWGITDSSIYDPAEKRRWISPHIGMLHESESAEHIVANNPAVVLADLDAKLAVLDEHQNVNDGSCGTCVDGGWGYPTHGGSSPQRHPCRTLRLLAVPFAAHPDYDERWRP